MENITDLMFIILVLFTWGSSSTITHLISLINACIDTLSDEEWQRLYSSAVTSYAYTNAQTSQRLLSFEMKFLPESLNARSVTLLGVRAKDVNELYFKYLEDYSGSDLVVLEFCQTVALNLLSSKKTSWNSALKVIKQSYMKGALSDRYAFQYFSRRTSENSLPDYIAEEISRQPDCYPAFLVLAAEAKCKNIVASKILPVGEIARRDKWFSI